VDDQLNIHSVYAGVRQITNWILINWARWIGIEYSIVDQIRRIRIKYLIVRIIRLGRLNLGGVGHCYAWQV
jgi:hypothetical protein